jgi:hypothetical protein
VKQKGRSVAVEDKCKAKRSVATHRKGIAKRHRINKKLNCIPEEECPTIVSGEIKWDEEHKKWRKIYYDEE